MRIQRSAQTLAIFGTLAAIAACGSSGQPQQSDPQVATVTQWDSGPIDRDYARERATMENRHQQEIAHPRTDESADQRAQRQAAEKQDLERRYESGKASHAQALPPSDRTHDADRPH